MSCCSSGPRPLKASLSGFPLLPSFQSGASLMLVFTKSTCRSFSCASRMALACRLSPWIWASSRLWAASSTLSSRRSSRSTCSQYPRTWQAAMASRSNLLSRSLSACSRPCLSRICSWSHSLCCCCWILFRIRGSASAWPSNFWKQEGPRLGSSTSTGLSCFREFGSLRQYSRRFCLWRLAMEKSFAAFCRSRMAFCFTPSRW
mmetsp:Transcript_101746/g.270682  ORF Transcript_101746/g.270682 Transcript_101746/m.270682 type:complete len:203 (+) Transcript_101746:312-920(+)